MPLLFTSSNQYFQDAAILQSRVWFVAPLAMDIYVATSFSGFLNTLVLTGGYFQTFTKNHVIDDSFLCYRIERIDHQALFPLSWKLTLTFTDQWFSVSGFVKKILQGMPVVSLLIFSLLTRVFPPAVAQVFTYISLVWLLITGAFYARKFVKYLLSIFKTKAITYQDVHMIYENPLDVVHVPPSFIDLCRTLHTLLPISSFVLCDGMLYIKQSLNVKNIVVNGEEVCRQSLEKILPYLNSLTPNPSPSERGTFTSSTP